MAFFVPVSLSISAAEESGQEDHPNNCSQSGDESCHSELLSLLSFRPGYTSAIGLTGGQRPPTVPAQDFNGASLVLGDVIDLDSTRDREDDLRLAVVDPGRELLGPESAEHNGVNHAKPGASQQGDDRLLDHRHADDDTVAASEPRYGLSQINRPMPRRRVPSRATASAVTTRRARRGDLR